MYRLFKGETMKFTFKTEKPTGKWSSFDSPTHYIKLNKRVVGEISSDKPFKISLMVIKRDINEDGNPDCKWKRIYFKKDSETLQEAKDFLNKDADKIISVYEFNYL
jgi:hypothetical protein